jgi:hypothetical protein
MAVTPQLQGACNPAETLSRISRRKQYQLLKTGEIKAKKDGYKTIIDLQSVDDFALSERGISGS